MVKSTKEGQIVTQAEMIFYNKSFKKFITDYINRL